MWPATEYIQYKILDVCLVAPLTMATNRKNERGRNILLVFLSLVMFLFLLIPNDSATEHISIRKTMHNDNTECPFEIIRSLD